jgi:hypothetical protein
VAHRTASLPPQPDKDAGDKEKAGKEKAGEEKAGAAAAKAQEGEAKPEVKDEAAPPPPPAANGEAAAGRLRCRWRRLPGRGCRAAARHQLVHMAAGCLQPR